MIQSLRVRCSDRGFSAGMVWCVAVMMIVLMPATSLFAMGAKQQAEKSNAAAPAAQPADSGVSVPISAVLENPTRFADKEIVLEGAFRGWKGGCSSSSLITRSDWVLEDATGCIYVTGRIPDGLSPAQPKGEHIIVKGVVVIDSKGKPAIQANQLVQPPISR